MNDPNPDPLETTRLEHTLAESLQARWPEREITARQVQTLLAKLETQNRKQSNPMQTRITNLLRPIVYMGGLALLVLFLSWIFGSIRPTPVNENTTPTAFTTSDGAQITNGENPDPRETPTSIGESGVVPDHTATPVDLPTPTPEPVSLPAVPANGFSTFPNVTFSFANALPTSPAQLTLYQQRPEGTLSEETVRQMAAQMGVNGSVTTYPGEGGDTIYNVSDGTLDMIFYGFPDQFTYGPSTYTPSTLTDPLPFDQRVAIAEDFLNAHGLLDYPYRAEPSETDPHGVRFVELLDGIPLVYGIGKNPGLIERINISIRPDGKISSLFHSHHHYQALDSYPILTAEQAWTRLTAPNAETRSRYAILAAPMSWTRAGTDPTEVLTGYLNNENGDATFYADDGRTLTLLDIPADMPLYPVLEIRGTVTEGGLDWSEMTWIDDGYGSSLSCGGGGGGGSSIPDANFGGGNFAVVMLDPLTLPTPTRSDSPIQPGDVIENVQGVLYIAHHLYEDGTEENVYNFWVPGDETTSSWTAFLEGDALPGIETLQNLPITVWGTVIRLDASGQAVITVDRYEETYPGMRIQAWLGTQQIVTLEGQEVLVLTLLDGSQYVLNNSIEWGAEDSLVGVEGDAAIVEGYHIPDKTFGGYPVIKEMSAELANGRTDLSNYVITSNLIGILEYSTSFIDAALAITGHVTIESVELMYAAVTLTRCNPEFASNPDFVSWFYAQPIWRFTGHFDDGRSFEVQIQALPEEYLQ